MRQNLKRYLRGDLAAYHLNAWDARLAANSGSVTAAQAAPVVDLIRAMDHVEVDKVSLLSHCRYALLFPGTTLASGLTPTVLDDGFGFGLAAGTSLVAGDMVGGGIAGNGSTKRFHTGLDIARIGPALHAMSVGVLNAGGNTGTYAGATNFRVSRNAANSWGCRDYRAANNGAGMIGGAPAVPLILTIERTPTPTNVMWEELTPFASTSAVVASTGTIYGLAADGIGTSPTSGRIFGIVVFDLPLSCWHWDVRVAWNAMFHRFRSSNGW